MKTAKELIDEAAAREAEILAQAKAAEDLDEQTDTNGQETDTNGQTDESTEDVDTTDVASSEEENGYETDTNGYETDNSDDPVVGPLDEPLADESPSFSDDSTEQPETSSDPIDEDAFTPDSVEPTDESSYSPDTIESPEVSAEQPEDAPEPTDEVAYAPEAIEPIADNAATQDESPEPTDEAAYTPESIESPAVETSDVSLEEAPNIATDEQFDPLPETDDGATPDLSNADTPDDEPVGFQGEIDLPDMTEKQLAIEEMSDPDLTFEERSERQMEHQMKIGASFAEDLARELVPQFDDMRLQNEQVVHDMIADQQLLSSLLRATV